ncbi:MAG: hypothetical protein IT254_07765 [Chitinophagaceae bacterium]|nr:hypothetical protein [Chitinophagaceae bacterium]
MNFFHPFVAVYFLFVHSWLTKFIRAFVADALFIRAFVAMTNSPLYFKLNRDKVKLKLHQSNFFVRIFSGTIFTPGAGAAKGLNIFPFPSALVRVERNKMRLDQHHKH